MTARHLWDGGHGISRAYCGARWDIDRDAATVTCATCGECVARYREETARRSVAPRRSASQIDGITRRYALGQAALAHLDRSAEILRIARRTSCLFRADLRRLSGSASALPLRSVVLDLVDHQYALTVM